MSLKIGITGGIGSGKSLICQIFAVMGVPTYNADLEAKLIMTQSAAVRRQLIEAFGANTYLPNGEVNRPFLSQQVFQDAQKLSILNGIVHPAVIQAAADWAAAQKSPYSLKEAALLFESGSYKKLDYTILVTAPVETRIARVMQRDHAAREQVEARIAQQLSDDEKIKLADFVIINDGKVALIPQILNLHQQFLNK
ncbi:dephospho-CoA kinase [Sphingobacteriaceae bacterium WQ 2009]|uniref:Dephospho-CoA kinase n=1 Tax=Rhinopithecimicrobium faecis TaxID=2820698 RepID=A0A8T4HDE6_9SPHI|nr:dephospho-CoA kinase [Sphingobacteriaceae bacterium WQ 2009]